MSAPPIASVAPLEPYVVRVHFENGEVRDVDIEPLLDGVAFRALRDPAAFVRVRVDEHSGSIAWANGADLDPDVIYGVAPPARQPGARVTTPQTA
jgi:Protein of unknown function (DUF2442)